jgi:hypothetical protein
MKNKILATLIAVALPVSALAQTVVYPSHGGTGTSTIPTYGQVLVGNSGGTYTPTATSSLGITGGGGGGGVTSITATSPLTGGTITTSGSIGLGTVGIGNGGTGQTSFGQGWIASNGTVFTSSTSPTVNYITATSTAMASQFPYASTTAFTSSNLFVTGTTTQTIGPISQLYAGSGSNTAIQLGAVNNGFAILGAGAAVDMYIGAVDAMEWTNANVFFNRTLSNSHTGTAYMPITNPTSPAPTYAFSGNTNTGMWSEVANFINFATNGIDRISISPIGVVAATSTIIDKEFSVSTSTITNVSFASSTAQLIGLGTGSMTLKLIDPVAGEVLRANVCNPTTTAGAINWQSSTTIHWMGGNTVPTQTTTANVCDLWTFTVTAGTSTPVIEGSSIAW